MYFSVTSNTKLNHYAKYDLNVLNMSEQGNLNIGYCDLQIL